MSRRIAPLVMLIVLLSLFALHGQTQDIFSVPQTSLIAFTSDLDGQTDIYTMDSEGNHRRRLTNTPERESDLIWSPNGKYLAFISSHYEPTTNTWADTLFVMGTDGSYLRALVNVDYSSYLYLRWVPDSQRLMFDVPSSEFGTMTAVVSIDQPEVVRFLGDKYDFGHIFSPDMSHIAYVHYGRSIYDGPDLYIMQADGSHKTRIMTDVWQFVWLPNSQELAYIHATNDQYYLSIITRDGGSLRRIPLPCCISRFKWSSDGTQFLFAGPDLFVMNADGTNFHQLTAFSYGQIDDYDWSPDGSQVVFSYQDVGTHPHSWPRTDRLYIVSIDGGYQRLITHEDIATIGPGEVAGNEGSQYPVWQPVLR